MLHVIYVVTLTLLSFPFLSMQNTIVNFSHKSIQQACIATKTKKNNKQKFVLQVELLLISFQGTCT